MYIPRNGPVYTTARLFNVILPTLSALTWSLIRAPASFAAIIYLFLSTCLGLQIRRSDIWEAFSFPSMAQVRERDRIRRQRASRSGEYELDDMDGIGMGMGYDRPVMGMGPEEVELMRRGGGGPRSFI